MTSLHICAYAIYCVHMQTVQNPFRMSSSDLLTTRAVCDTYSSHVRLWIAISAHTCGSEGLEAHCSLRTETIAKLLFDVLRALDRSCACHKLSLKSYADICFVS
jgi:hypothetical protein